MMDLKKIYLVTRGGSRRTRNKTYIVTIFAVLVGLTIKAFVALMVSSECRHERKIVGPESSRITSRNPMQQRWQGVSRRSPPSATFWMGWSHSDCYLAIPTTGSLDIDLLTLLP